VLDPFGLAGLRARLEADVHSPAPLECAVEGGLVFYIAEDVLDCVAEDVPRSLWVPCEGTNAVAVRAQPFDYRAPEHSRRPYDENGLQRPINLSHLVPPMRVCCPPMRDPRLPYSRALASWDNDGLMAALADDVIIRVAVHDAPMESKQVADFLFGVLAEELGQITVNKEILEGDRAAVLFETSIQGQGAQGLNVLGFDASGLIQDLTVFFRPLASLSLIAEVIGARMAEQFGPAPE